MVFRAELDDFASFYERAYPVAFRVAYGILGDRGFADDAVQDAFASAWRDRGGFHGDAPAQDWFLRIVVNRAIATARRPRPRVVALEIAPNAVADGDDAGQIDSRVTLEESLRRLDARARAAVVLRYYCDVDYATIAGILGTNANHVGVILHRALLRLRTDLDRPAPLASGREEACHG